MHSELKKWYYGRHFWAKGYCFSTVGHEERVRKYLKWQLRQYRIMDRLLGVVIYREINKNMEVYETRR